MLWGVGGPLSLQKLWEYLNNIYILINIIIYIPGKNMDAKNIEKRIAVLEKRRKELRYAYHTALDRSFVEKNLEKIESELKLLNSQLS